MNNKHAVHLNDNSSICKQSITNTASQSDSCSFPNNITSYKNQHHFYLYLLTGHRFSTFHWNQNSHVMHIYLYRAFCHIATVNNSFITVLSTDDKQFNGKK